MSLLDMLQRDAWLRDVDHALALALMRLRPQTDMAVLVGAALASRALGFGHSSLPLARATELFGEIAPEREPPALPPLQQWEAALRGSDWVSCDPDPDALQAKREMPPLVFESGRLYLRRYRDYEQRLADALRRRAQPSHPPDAADPHTQSLLAALFPEAAATATSVQADAARHLLESRLLLLTGGPGTGKTTTVARALMLLLDQAQRQGRAAPRTALAAPTGKAAARLVEALRDNLQGVIGGGIDTAAWSDALPRQASTLHRLLGWRADSTRFRHDASNPLPYDLVVVDEASMVDLPLMCKLVDAVPPDATLLLVGDRDQLPSVETGDVLAAMCDAADQGGPLAPHRIDLQRSWRQGAGVDVPELAALVRNGNADAAIAGLEAARFRGVQWLPPRGDDSTAALVAQSLPWFRAVQDASSPDEGLRHARMFRVLTAVREGHSGSAPINQGIARALQPPGPRHERFFHGALLIITENSYRHGLFNGDVGLVWRDPDPARAGALQVWFERNGDDGHGTLRAWSPAALPAHDLAFALTVHKSQGSEFEHVLLVLPATAPGAAGNRALSRELLYTGLTRCRSSLGLIADAHAIRAAITRRAQRWSGLAERLG